MVPTHIVKNRQDISDLKVYNQETACDENQMVEINRSDIEIGNKSSGKSRHRKCGTIKKRKSIALSHYNEKVVGVAQKLDGTSESGGETRPVELPCLTVTPHDARGSDDLQEHNTVADKRDHVFTTMQLGKTSLLRLSLLVGDRPVVAAVDTAAEVSIISDKLYDSLKDKPPTLRETFMHAAGRGMRMKTFVVGPVNLTLGSKSYKMEVYVAPIQDDMLLGLNFMVTYGVTVDLEKFTFNIGGEKLEMSPGPKKTIPVVSKVWIDRRVVVPPHSAVHVTAKLEETLDNYIIEACNEDLPILIPRCLYHKQERPTLCLVNASDRYFTIKKNTVVARAETIQNMESDVAVDSITEDQEEQGELSNEWTDLLERSSGKLSAEQKQKLKELLIEFNDIFSKDEFDIGTLKGVEHCIDTGQAAPIKLRMRRTPLQFVDEEKEQLTRMLKAGVIQPSVSEWAAAPVLIRKSDGKVRYAIDYRKLNAVTKKDVYPLPLIEECLDTLAGNEWFSKLDANSAYWQVNVKEEDQPKTAFITKYGSFMFTRMSFGLCNAPSTYARAMDLVLRGLTWQVVLCFLDDILVMGKAFSDHLKNLRSVFERFRQHGIKLKPKKCDLCKSEVTFLGRKVDKDGMAIGREYVEAINKWSVPTNTKEVEKFLGFVNYHRNFIKGYSKIAKPLTGITGKNTFKWGQDQQEAYDILKTALQTAPVLTLPNATDQFILDTDASDLAIGAELIQVQNGKERVVAYGSFTLSPAQRRYCTTRKELLAVVRFVQHFRHYLLGREFVVRTDHSSLQWLINFKEPQGQLARWLEVLSQYHVKVQHRAGKHHVNADILSRLVADKPCQEMSIHVEPEMLPCGGCKHCLRVHRMWQDFVSVDNVIPLSTVPKLSSTVLKGKMDAVGHDTLVCLSRLFEGEGDLVDADREIEVQVLTQENNSLGIQYTKEQLSTEQQKDPDLQLILYWLEHKTEPPEADMFIAGPAAKKYLVNKEQFHLDNQHVLWNLSKSGDQRLVVPKPFVSEVTQLNHNLPITGHQGIDRTRERIRKKFYWYRMNESVKRFVQSCGTCNKHKKATRKARCPLTKYHAGAPMERVHIDFLGPLPESSKGNAHILVMVDQFTKWVEIIPLPSQTAEMTAKAAVNEFFTRFGCPFQIHSDQGRNFESRLFKSLCETLHIEKTKTTPYRPSANGQVERFNRTLMDAVRCFVSKSQTDWDEYLPQLASAIRSSVNRMTGLTPNHMMLGREINLPSDLVFRSPETKNSENEEDYVTKLKEEIFRAHDIARRRIKVTQSYMKRDYDLKIRKHEYKPGDAVYVLDTATIKGRNKKLDPPWKGPGVVAKKISSYVYKVKLDKMILTINHDRMKKCLDRNLPTWLRRAQNLIKTGEDILASDSANLYCLCRKGDHGGFMIECDLCDEWYHGECVGVTAELAGTFTWYHCPTCQRSEISNSG